MKTLVCLIFSFLAVHSCWSQDKLKADAFYQAGYYMQALTEYLKIEKKEPTDLEVKQRIGTCYLNVHDDKARAIPYLEYCYKQGKYKSILLLQLAQAYQFAYRFPDAISFYNKYREKVSGKDASLVDHYLETCDNAKALMKKPVNVTFENLGKEINTAFADYYPFVTSDQGTLYFTSRRDQNTGKVIDYNGYYTSDIYFSKVKNGEWTKAKKLPPTINTAEDEQCVGISGDGNELIIYMENPENPGDLLHTEMTKSKAFARPVPFKAPVNTEDSEQEGCFAAGSDILYFTSYRKDGLGESDIYVTKKLPNGEWGIPQNLGPTINTPYKEAFPVISEDGQTLYFSSQGHTSMGGYDIFRAKWNEAQQKWEKPVNIGYPVNTTDDDMMFSIAGNQRDGYISAVRKEGFGDLDIYKIIFNDADKPLTALKGVIQEDSTQKHPQATITITDLKSNEALETKDINPTSGKYIFIVEPGKYRVEIEAEGYNNFSEDFIIYDKSDFVSELEKNFKLHRKLSAAGNNSKVIAPKK